MVDLRNTIFLNPHRFAGKNAERHSIKKQEKNEEIVISNQVGETRMHTIEGSWSGLAKPARRYDDPESSTAGSIAALASPMPSWLGKKSHQIPGSRGRACIRNPKSERKICRLAMTRSSSSGGQMRAASVQRVRLRGQASLPSPFWAPTIPPRINARVGAHIHEERYHPSAPRHPLWAPNSRPSLAWKGTNACQF